MVTGRCECGKVAFETPEVRDTVTVCHCSQCRRASGHLWASTEAPGDTVTFTEDEGLTWYVSSDWATRGFCKFCGASLFWRLNGDENLSIASGCLDDTAQLSIGKHIFVADKGDYYARPTDAPCLDTH